MAENSRSIEERDQDVRNSVGRLLRSVGWDTQLFASIPDFLKFKRSDRISLNAGNPHSLATAGP
jgi:FixJ family two-component response regulator